MLQDSNVAGGTLIGESGDGEADASQASLNGPADGAPNLDGDQDPDGDSPGGTAVGPVIPDRTVREIKADLSHHLRMSFENIAYLASRGEAPYVTLVAQCREVTAELNTVAKLRDTRETKAEAEEKAKTATGQPAQASTRASAVAPTERAAEAVTASAAATAGSGSGLSKAPDLAS